MLRILLALLVLATGCVHPIEPIHAWLGRPYEKALEALGPPTMFVPSEETLLMGPRRLPIKIKNGYKAIWMRGTVGWATDADGTVMVDIMGGRRSVIGGRCQLEFMIVDDVIIHVVNGCSKLHRQAR